MPEISLHVRTQRGAAVKMFIRSQVNPSTIFGPFAAYLDTGASVTVLDPGVIASVGLEPVAEAGLHVLGREEISHHSVYEVEIGLAGEEGERVWVPVVALAGPVNPKGTVAALSRDLLAHFIFCYNGPNQRFTLRW